MVSVEMAQAVANIFKKSCPGCADKRTVNTDVFGLSLMIQLGVQQHENVFTHVIGNKRILL